MTQAMNLANFSNYLDTSGQVAPTVLNAPVPVSKGGTGGTTATGTGNLVLATSPTISTPSISGGTFSGPTLTTPVLGTPASGVMTNVTGLPLTTGVTGILPVTNGGTGVTTSTGSGSNVLNTSPTIISPTINGTPVMGASVLTSGTAQNSTTGTFLDFTSLPNWVKRITVMLNGISTNGSSLLQIQLGSTSILSANYIGYTWTGNTNNASHASGFLLQAANSSGYNLYGHAVLTNLSGNIWVFSTASGATLSNTGNVGGGCNTTLSGTLDRIRITTVNGTDTFDNGSINILYE